MKLKHFTIIKPLSEEDIAELVTGELKLINVLTKEQFEACKYEVSN